MSSDRTPAEVIAAAFSVGRGVTNSPEALAARVLDALAAAGFRVVPEPDDTTRALAQRLRADADRYEDTAQKMGPLGRGWQRQANDLRAAADLIEAQAAELAALRQRLDDSWYIDIGARYDAAVAQRDALLDAIGDPEELRGHELDMSDGTVNTPEVTHEIVRDILLRIAAAVEHTQEGT